MGNTFQSVRNILSPQIIQIGRGTKESKTRNRALLFILFTIAICIYGAVAGLCKILAKGGFLDQAIIEQLIIVGCDSMFVLMFISAVASTTGNFFTSEQLDVYLIAPVDRKELFAARFLLVLLESASMYIVFSLPAIFALVLHGGAPVSMLLYWFFGSIPFILLTALLGILMATVLAPIIAWAWRRGILLICVAVVMGVYSISRLGKYLHDRGGFSQGELITFKRSLADAPIFLIIPDTFAKLLIRPFQVITENIFIIPVIYFLAAFVLYHFVERFMSYRLLSIRSRGDFTRSKRQSRHFAQDVVARTLSNFVHSLPMPQQSRAMIYKDMISLLRDRSQSIQLLLLLGIISFFASLGILMGKALELQDAAQRTWWATIGSSNILITGFVMTTLLTRLVYPSVSLEGRSLWILQVTPLDSRRFVRTKYIAWLPLIFSCTFLMLELAALTIPLPLSSHAIFLLTAILFSLGSTSLAISLGTRFARFDWDSPSQISIGLGGLLLLIQNLLFVFALWPFMALLFAFSVVPELQKYIQPFSVFFFELLLASIAGCGVIALVAYALQRGVKGFDELRGK
jgi:ABC-2 type transport system permease protein